MQKACSICGAFPFESYAGTANRCKECHKKAARAYREKNLDRVRLYDKARASLPHRMTKNAEIGTAWRAENDQRYRAQNAVNNALRDGKLTRHPCLVCGERAVAHHPDYSRPLDVVWLCQAHHKQAHALVEKETT